MARPRDPRRDEAKEAWLKSNGDMKLKDLATYLGVTSSTVRKWKAQDNWEAELKGSAPKLKRSAPKRGAPKEETARGSPGAPSGNKNAKGNSGGAPSGNKNAVGNAGGSAPPGNKNAVTTGEYESIFLDVLSEEEQILFEVIDTSPSIQIDESIRMLSLRERRMLQRLNKIMDGMTESEKRILKERLTVKIPVEKFNDKTGQFETIMVKKDEMVVTEEEETSFRKIDDILKIEDALTRVQARKQAAIKMKHEMQEVFEHRKEIAEAKMEVEKRAADKGLPVNILESNVDLSELSDEELEKALKKYES